MTMPHRTWNAGALATLVTLTTLLAAQLGCDSTPPPQAPPLPPVTASAPPPAPAAISSAVIGIPVEPDKIAKVVNPKAEPPFAGPTGTLRGTVRITGDAPPDLPAKLPEGACRGEAAATHGKLFRTGEGGALADALVAVTGYQGYVPPAGPAEKLTIHACSLSRRTLVATYGQRLEIANLDPLESYMPYLDGGPGGAILVAIPRGDAVRLYPNEPGHYLIRDQLPHDYMTADVFVLAYATHDVTTLQGKYEIKGIPVGQVEVNAMLPATNKHVTQRLEIKPGDNTLDLTLTFNAKTDATAKKSASGDRKPEAKDPKPPGPKG